MKQTTNKKGFTIIEVVLVLAIAGLIFLMVFIALPALQRSQRDTQRRHDLDRVLSQVTSYMTNNRNQPPGSDELKSTGRFYTGYMKSGNDLFEDPNGEPYVFDGGDLKEDATYASEKNKIYYTKGAICKGESLVTNQGSSKMAFRMVLEGGGIACVSN